MKKVKYMIVSCYEMIYEMIKRVCPENIMAREHAFAIEYQQSSLQKSPFLHNTSKKVCSKALEYGSTMWHDMVHGGHSWQMWIWDPGQKVKNKEIHTNIDKDEYKLIILKPNTVSRYNEVWTKRILKLSV